MSTRSGEFVTLKKLIDEVGVDAVRYFFLERRSDQTLEFDIELAKKKNKDNPVYYIQYAHARICSLMKELPERGFNYSNSEGLEPYHLYLLIKRMNLFHKLTATNKLLSDVLIKEKSILYVFTLET